VYYRKFIQNFVKVAASLTNLAKKSTRHEWTDNCEEAFQELKKRLIRALVLALPGSDEQFVVYNDASKGGLGCVLMQNSRVIADVAQ